MKKVHTLVIKSFIGPLTLTFFIVLIVYILQFLWLYIDELAGKGLEINIMGELLFQFSLVFVPTALPLAILFAALMTFGSLGENFELTALKSSGISLQRIMMPLMAFIFVLSIASFFFSNHVVPYSYRKARTLLYDIRNKRPELNIQAGSFYNGIDGYSIKIGEKDPETNMLSRVLIHDHHEQRGNVSVIYGDSGYIRVSSDKSGLVITLFNGYSYTDLEENVRSDAERTYPFRRDSFEEQTVVIELSGFDFQRSDENIYGSNSSMLNIRLLTNYIDSLNQRFKTRRNNYFSEFNEEHIFQGRNNNPLYVPRSSGPPPFEVRSTYDSLDHFLKNMAVTRAIENIKEASIFIDQKTDALHNEVKNIKRYEADWHKKLTLPFACLVFFFIGAPLGAIIRKGGLGTPAVISVLFFVVYYVISMSAEKLVKENQVSSLGGMWLSSFILLPIGIMLTYMATTDSVVMNTDTYINFIKDKFNKLIPGNAKTGM